MRQVMTIHAYLEARKTKTIAFELRLRSNICKLAYKYALTVLYLIVTLECDRLRFSKLLR